MNPLGAHGRPGPMPYRMDALIAAGVDLTWTDAAHHGPWSSRVGRLVRGAGRRVAPARQGAVTARVAQPLVRQAHAVVSVFENAGIGHAARQVSGAPPHLMMLCWLAEDARHMSASQRRAFSRSLRSVSWFTVYSRNQVDLLADLLGVDRQRIRVVPFGVDVDLYRDSAFEGRGGGGCVAVGSDSRRDYATLFEAFRGTGIPITLACQPRNIEGLDVPPEVTVRYGLYDQDYRDLLHHADLVVTTTVAPAYPSGQSVVLEAMAMGAPTVTTDSAAMRDYVQPGVTGELVVPGDPAALRAVVTTLLADPARRRALALAGGQRVRSCFTSRHMWSAVADLVFEATGRD